MWGYGDAGGGRRQELRGTEKSAGGHRRRGLRTAGGGTVGAGGALLAAPPSVTVQPHGELPPLPIVLHLDGAALFQEAERRRVRHSRAGPRGCAVWERGAAGYREGTAGGRAGPGRAGPWRRHRELPPARGRRKPAVRHVPAPQPMAALPFCFDTFARLLKGPRHTSRHAGPRRPRVGGAVTDSAGLRWCCPALGASCSHGDVRSGLKAVV